MEYYSHIVNKIKWFTNPCQPTSHLHAATTIDKAWHSQKDAAL
jgi:hypothetical protein